MAQDDIVAATSALRLNCSSPDHSDHSHPGKAREQAVLLALNDDLRGKVLEDCLSRAADEGRPGEVFDAAATLRLVCKVWAAEVKPLMEDRVGLILGELSRLEGLEGSPECKLDELRHSRMLDLSAEFAGAVVDRQRVNMLLAVVHSNRDLEWIKVHHCRLPVKELSGKEAISEISLSNRLVCDFDLFIIGALIKGNGEATTSFL